MSSPTPPPISRSFSQQQNTSPSSNLLGVNGTSGPGSHAAGIRGHQHSHSHSGAPASSQSNTISPIGRGPSPASANPLSKDSSLNVSGAAAGGNKFRASMDVAGRSMNRLSAGPGPRPTSELLSSGYGGADTEKDAIDRWFEDLQHYEQTLEEMAAASLDQNFKEELGAIEQWFRVLSEAERTAALYSLLQSSTQVQIRFFITVLQQIARNDPTNGGLFSPSNPQQSTMEAQMDAKLASMGLKSPASPVIRQFARQSMGATGNEFLSPHSAMNNEDNAASLLASQRAKLKAQAHRTSAPGTLASNNFGNERATGGLWGSATTPEAIAEQSVRSSSPNSQRPKSTGSDYSIAGNPSNNILRSPNLNATTGFEDLSPMVGGGSWASMVNTPLVPMFGQSTNSNVDDAPLSPRLDNVNGRLGAWNSATNSVANGQTQANPNLVLDDAKKFRRTGRVASGTTPTSATFGNEIRRPLSGNGQYSQQRATSNPVTSLGAQQAALSAQQNWRAANLLAPNSGNSMLSASTPLSAAGNMTPAEMANVLLQQQQQMAAQLQAQMQLQQNLMGMNLMNGMGGMNGLMGGMLSPNNNMMQMGMGLGQAGGLNVSAGAPGNYSNSGGMSPGGGGRRSPRPSDHRSMSGNRTPSSAVQVAGSGSNPDEAVDVHLLNDISGWMRSLRLHKYTPNFEGCKWQDMVKMDEAALEAKGVSAQGARRKLLKVFENIRVQLWGEERPPSVPGVETNADE